MNKLWSVGFKLSMFWFLEATSCCLPYHLIISLIFFYLGPVLAFPTLSQFKLMLIIINTVASIPNYIFKKTIGDLCY